MNEVEWLMSRLLPGVERARASEVSLEARPLRGGLVSPDVALLTLRCADARGRRHVLRCVRKRLEGGAAREVRVYERLVRAHAADLAPALIGARPARAGGAHLYVEAVRRTRAWPWRDLQHTESLLQELAPVHALDGAAARRCVADWAYDEELERCARRAVEDLERARSTPPLRPLARSLPALRRVVEALGPLREELMATRGLGRAVIHGDVHTGNAQVRRRGGAERPVLFDWGRARLGSPLEDVSSWLLSLAAWEPSVMRRHDTLLVAYLRARGLRGGLTSALRRAYWVAAASNVLAGALSFHLQVAMTSRGAQAAGAAAAARRWLRAVERADRYR